MGKTYKTLPDDLFLDDFSDDGLDDIDFDEDMESLLLDEPHKRQKHRRGRRKNSEPFAHTGNHRLPADWRDFDYANVGSQDVWR
ncbi:MAG: hypothetical protein HKN42_01935 [Granulosicoccus sp.]|nr:hypothetical protein [Granulosicoccus sp.]